MTNNTYNYTARITARGIDSTVPDNETAVDAEILLDGRPIGDVTLLPDHMGELDRWGTGLDHWADCGIQTHLDELDGLDHTHAIEHIVEAVREANNY